MSEGQASFKSREHWLTRGVVGIVLATFFSDVGHEMATAVLPLYLGSIGLGAAALGMMEGVADLTFSMAKLAGGVLGHHVQKKRPWAALGYLVTALGTGAMAIVHSVPLLAGVRAVAWAGRGMRSGHCGGARGLLRCELSNGGAN